MKIGIIATARSGGRTLGQWLENETDYIFLHEPTNNEIEINIENNLIIKWLVSEWDNVNKTNLQIDKWIGLYRNDCKEAAISHLRASKTNEWHKKYRITNEWVVENENEINELENWMLSCNAEVKGIAEIGLIVSYEGIYNTGEDIPKLLKYLNIENPKYLHLLDSSNRFRVTENNKKKSALI